MRTIRFRTDKFKVSTPVLRRTRLVGDYSLSHRAGGKVALIGPDRGTVALIDYVSPSVVIKEGDDIPEIIHIDVMKAKNGTYSVDVCVSDKDTGKTNAKP